MDAANNTYTGPILTLEFRIRDDAPLGESRITLDSPLDVGNFDEERLPCTPAVGTVTVTGNGGDTAAQTGAPQSEAETQTGTSQSEKETPAPAAAAESTEALSGETAGGPAWLRIVLGAVCIALVVWLIPSGRRKDGGKDPSEK